MNFDSLIWFIITMAGVMTACALTFFSLAIVIPLAQRLYNFVCAGVC